MSDAELERFKTEINLSEYAAAHGYQLAQLESSRNSVAMKHPNGDKIIIARGSDNHWIYFSVRSDQDNGSIIDFVQKHQGGSLGKVRQILRPWVGQGTLNLPRPAPGSFASQVEKSSKDRQAIIKAFAAMSVADDHPYLETRAIGKELLSDPRFAGRVYVDRHGAAIFPHEDEQGLCSYEIKNVDFTGYPPGSEKALWMSNTSADDRRLVICESGIDALSYHALHPDPLTRYASAGGGWSGKTRALLKRAGADHPGPEVVLAFDNDDQGRKYEAEARALLAATGKAIFTDYPPLGLDWNEQLKGVSNIHRARMESSLAPPRRTR